MDNVLAALNSSFGSRFVVALLTLAIGGYLFAKLTERRARKEKVREQTIQFLEEVGNELNSVFSPLFSLIRSGNRKGTFSGRDNKENLAKVDEKAGGLFTKRFSVAIRSKALLESHTFLRQYEHIMWETARILHFIRSYQDKADVEKNISVIRQGKERVESEWSELVPGWTSPREPFKPTCNYPFDELEQWAQMLWDRAVWMLSDNLESALR